MANAHLYGYFIQFNFTDLLYYDLATIPQEYPAQGNTSWELQTPSPEDIARVWATAKILLILIIN